MAPRRIAALAVCLLALAAGAAAQTCTASSISLELVSAASGLESHEIAKCLSSAVVSIAADCKVSIAAPTADNSYVDAMWTTTGMASYSDYKLCPASSTPVYDTDVPTSLKLAFNGYTHGFDTSGATPTALKGVGVTDVAFASFGKVTITIDSTATLVYAIRATVNSTTSFDNTAAVAVTKDNAATGFTANTEFLTNANIGMNCGSGRYGLLMGDFKLCPLCPAGSVGTGGFSCKPCAAGTASGAVGFSGTCASCAAGTYAQDGTLPTPSEGNAILTFGTRLTTCPVNTNFPIPLWNTCKSWSTAAGTLDLKLALAVADDCSITIRPISDKSCADSGAVKDVPALFPRTVNTNGLNADGNYTYTFNDLKIRAYYTSPTTIRTLLPSTNGGATSFMLNINAGAGPVSSLTFFAATNKPGETGNLGTSVNNVCTSNPTIAGGNLLLSTVANCPGGSYSDNGCKPCPQGQTCAGAAAAPVSCTADNANPYLGQGANSCTSCNNATTKYTSLEGAAYCTVPYFDRTCSDSPLWNSGGYEWDEHNATCVKCRPGTYRSTAMLRTGASPNPECQECAVGYYSGEGASDCTICPTGQYSPSTGMADQQVGSNGIRCLLCPVGSIALTSTQSMNNQTNIVAGNDYRNEKALSQGASQCDACPSGTFANTTKTQDLAAAVGCSLCPTGTFRSGDAAPENNVCRTVPPGYKATGVLDATNKIGATDYVACSAGQVSFWAGGVRTPTDATACQPCTNYGGTIAPRTGMAACTPCKGGFYPNTARTACDQCAVGTYRTLLSNANTCTQCPAGSEIGTSGRTACTKCRKGFYMTSADSTTKDTCTACPRNKYVNAVGATSDCTWCSRGYETQDTGNSECTPCSAGFYNPKTADQSTTPACIAAPQGTFVNTTGAFFASLCPLGTFNDDTAQDACEPCPPGQYANTLGNRACKTCPAGTYSGAQASTCKACAAGYSAPAGSSSCGPCKPGTYASTARSGSCTLCPKGKQCPTPATTTPRDCPAGSFAARDGSVLCTACPVNTFAATTGLTKCTACAAGSNTRGLTGQKACQPVRVTPTGLRRLKL
ncbi:hypothetical protein COHA_002190 [Chlorella ohadii]|uniref:Tyrosine-protein kinase ephrin type A/B receptor-like domain-containing protein n=1 Tax=Chlorella ohadii TaxID=2649997 RepID=A0AAD5DVF1_9CHLO|nr:hypothetical protein COHA_002190 [Chlorella ohadii]